MNDKLNSIRAKAIGTREDLLSANTADRRPMAKLDRIIRGTVLVIGKFRSLWSNCPGTRWWTPLRWAVPPSIPITTSSPLKKTAGAR